MKTEDLAGEEGERREDKTDSVSGEMEKLPPKSPKETRGCNRKLEHESTLAAPENVRTLGRTELSIVSIVP